MLGLARELLSIDCRIIPETEKAQAARTAARVLGILTYLIILYVLRVLSPCHKEEIISDKGIFVEPMLILIKTPMNSITVRKAITVTL